MDKPVYIKMKNFYSQVQICGKSMNTHFKEDTIQITFLSAGLFII